ncbi:hypothetical protein ACVW00_000559 [Marmoricola sp. URHA0025 HA25]
MTEQGELSRMLKDKVQTFDVLPSDLHQVEARAHRIRARRRVTAVGAVAAAVVAAAVPTFLALQPHDDAARPVGPTPSPSSTATTAAPSALEKLSQGDAPRIDWRFGSTVHLEGGRTLTLPDGEWTRFAPYRGGVVAGTSNNVADEVVVVGADGSVVSRGAGNGPVVSADGSRVTWWSPKTDGGAFVSGPTSDAGGGADTSVPAALDRPRPVGYLGDDLVYRVDADTGGVAMSCGASCTVAIPGMTMVLAVDSERRLLAGYTTEGCPTKVFRVPDLPAGTSRTLQVTSSWPCVRETPDSFNPDGSALVLEHRGSDGRWNGIVVRDSTSGKVRTRYQTSPGVQVTDAAWEDDSHVLVSVYSPADHLWAVLRVGPDGSVDRATPVVPGDDALVPFAFGVRP